MTDTPFPDIEAVLVSYLDDLAPTGDQTPETISGPFITVQRVGGFDDGITDRPRVELACFSPTRRESQRLSEQVRQRMLAAISTDAAGVFIDNVITESQSGRTAYPNEDVRRIPAVYRITLRRPRTT